MINNQYNRRDFIKGLGLASGAAMTGIYGGRSPMVPKQQKRSILKSIEIDSVDSDFEREPLVRPFGFKGGYMREIWQTAAMLKSKSGIRKVGLCTQNVLWSDANVFSSSSESAGNATMYMLTAHAAQLLKNQPFENPVALLNDILPEVYTYGQKITGIKNLRKTFALNALVGIDNAAWLIYAQENNITNFDQLIPAAYKPSLSHHHSVVASIPLMAYNIPVDEIKTAVDQGYFFMKIKIGQPGTQDEMLEKDKARLTAIHQAIGNARTKYTKDGKLPYYFDANGRYEKKETLFKLLDHARKIGAFDQIVLIEEPFPEELEVDVRDIPIRLAADESAHTDADALARIQMGYRAIALKAIAKTMSMTMKIAQVAYENSIPCFCADLTVNPILVEWNKAIAARLSPFPGLGLGLLESNGHQNYKNWETMRTYHPKPNAVWANSKNGVFELNDDYYKTSGELFTPSKHYESMFL